MQPRFLTFTLSIGLLGMLCWTPRHADGGHWGACGGGFYGGAMYGGAMYGGPMYGSAMYDGPGTTTYYAPPASYAVPVYDQSYQAGPMAFGRPYSAASPYAAPTYNKPYSAMRPSLPQAYEQPRSAPASRATPARPTTTISIAMNDNRFEPNSINVQPGTTVRWTNNGAHAHTVTAKNESWDSGDIKPGATYSATFQQPGTYQYFCRHHAGMEGTIVVGPSAANRSASPRSPGY